MTRRHRGGRVALLWLVLALAACGNPARHHLDRADDLAFQGRPKAALAEVKLALDALRGKQDARSQKLRLEALARGGRLCHLFLHAPKAALTFYRALVEDAPGSDLAFQARQQMAEIHLVDLSDRAGAIAQYQALVAAFPERPGVDHFQYQVAQGYFHLREYAQTRTEARHLVDRYPKSPWVDDALYLVGAAWHAQGKLDKAIDAYQTLVTRFPHSKLVPRAQVEIGNCLEEGGHDARALAVYLAALPTHPDPTTVHMKIERLQARMAAAGVGGTKADLRPKH